MQCHGQSSKNSITLAYGLNHTSGGKCNAIMGRMAAAYFHRLVRGKFEKYIIMRISRL